jgi:hypothetical protein
MKAQRLFLALVGCAVVAGIVSLIVAGGDPHLPAATYLGPLTNPVDDDHGAITLAAPSKATGAVSWFDAYTTGCTTGDTIMRCASSSSSTVDAVTRLTMTKAHDRRGAIAWLPSRNPRRESHA